MTAVAAFLLAATAVACVIIVILFGGLYALSVERNEERDRADRMEREAEGLQAELNAAMGRLTRRRKPIAHAGEMTS